MTFLRKNLFALLTGFLLASGTAQFVQAAAGAGTRAIVLGSGRAVARRVLNSTLTFELPSTLVSAATAKIIQILRIPTDFLDWASGTHKSSWIDVSPLNNIDGRERVTGAIILVATLFAAIIREEVDNYFKEKRNKLEESYLSTVDKIEEIDRKIKKVIARGLISPTDPLYAIDLLPVTNLARLFLSEDILHTWVSILKQDLLTINSSASTHAEIVEHKETLQKLVLLYEKQCARLCKKDPNTIYLFWGLVIAPCIMWEIIASYYGTYA